MAWWWLLCLFGGKFLFLFDLFWHHWLFFPHLVCFDILLRFAKLHNLILWCVMNPQINTIHKQYVAAGTAQIILCFSCWCTLFPPEWSQDARKVVKRKKESCSFPTPRLYHCHWSYKLITAPNYCLPASIHPPVTFDNVFCRMHLHNLLSCLKIAEDMIDFELHH